MCHSTSFTELPPVSLEGFLGAPPVFSQDLKVKPSQLTSFPGDPSLPGGPIVPGSP